MKNKNVNSLDTFDYFFLNRLTCKLKIVSRDVMKYITKKSKLMYMENVSEITIKNVSRKKADFASNLAVQHSSR